jgi:hypothetical protein
MTQGYWLFFVVSLIVAAWLVLGVTLDVYAQTCPCSIWNNATTPAVAAASDGNGLELGLKFQTSINGYITDIRFYKGTGNTGTHVGHLWTSTGTLLAHVTFTNETATGWQQATLPTAVAIAANTTYVVSYYAPVGHYAVDSPYFTAALINTPLQALASGASGGNGVYQYGAASFPTQTFNTNNYWVDVVFSTTAPANTLSPTVTAVAPLNGTANVDPGTNITATFSEAMNAATITATTVQLRDSSGALVSATVTYDATKDTATLDPTVTLAPLTTYTATITGGTSGVSDMAGNVLAADFNWSFTTGLAVDQGPGGPILVITDDLDPFGRYYAEILRTEGFNAFTIKGISSVTAAMLTSYDVVILDVTGLTSLQVSMFTTWVNAGGNLIAMRPDPQDPQLAGLLGLTATSSTLMNGYLLINTSAGPGVGLVNQTVQFRGPANLYTLNGATSLATLYSNATTATTNPAVTLHSVGTNGGYAAAFAYSLALSVIDMRQGNAAWSGTDRDGMPPIRSDDMYFGNAAGDQKPDWIDLDKVAIPQADEQQRLLANLILTMNLTKKPLPRFWYFPRGAKAVVVMTGDDHANGGTAGRFDQYLANSPAGCSVANWECIRGTSYIYVGTPLTDAQAASYTAQGFEVGLHVNTGCADWTPASLAGFYNDQLQSFAANYPSLPSPTTNRTHCIAWSDYATQAKVELANGIRLDTTYYFWPPTWVLDRPGFFTGSGMPMRFVALDGTMIDVYQATSQMTDESGQTYPATITTLLENALGLNGYYGAFTANFHTDNADSTQSDATVPVALARGVPIVSARQMLTWLDGRNGSSFSAIGWNVDTLSFTISVGVGANGLQAMVPWVSAIGSLANIKQNGNPIAYTMQSIKGLNYAVFPATNGTYQVQYVPAAVDTTPPTVSSTSPASGATSVAIGTAVTATFSEAMDAATITSSTFELRNAANALAAAVSYNGNTATLTPNSSLVSGTTYTARVHGGSSGVTDLAGNALAQDYSWSFTTVTPPPCPCSIWNNGTTPAVAAANDSSSIEVGMKFQADVNGYITGIRFYKGAGNTGTHMGHLWTSGGSLLASVNFASETATGWQQANFVPVVITAGTTYVVSYFAPVGRYALNEPGFTTGVTTTPLRALADGASGGNGVYKYGSSGFPTLTYNASNYWVDVVFNTTVPPDTTPPTVSGQTPAGGATGVQTGATVQATFSEAMNATTITTSSFILRDANNTIAASVSYDSGTFTATLTPSIPLALGATYTATVKGGSGGVTDVAGNALAADFTWSFTTGTQYSCPCSLWSSTTIPTVPAEPDGSAVELGVKFRAAVNGYIKAIRFYKGTGNNGTHVGHLWTSGGTQLARATFTNETATGWQQVNLSSSVAIAANTVYVVSYYAPVGHYSFDPNYFSTAYTNSPLRTLADGEQGGNAVYRYVTGGGFPTQTYQSGNYWVDVVFSTTP